jgi:hypothetical protein
MKDCILTIGQAQTLGVPVPLSSVSVNLANAVECAEWVSSWPIYRDNGETDRKTAAKLGVVVPHRGGVGYIAAHITVAAESGMIRLPEFPPNELLIGGVRFVTRLDRGPGWWTLGDRRQAFFETKLSSFGPEYLAIRAVGVVEPAPEER